MKCKRQNILVRQIVSKSPECSSKWPDLQAASSTVEKKEKRLLFRRFENMKYVHRKTVARLVLC